MTTDLKPGDTCYDGAGLKYEFIGPMPNGAGFAVYPMIYEFDNYSEGDREVTSETVAIIAKVYAKAPAPAYEKSIEEATARLRKIDAEIASKRAELNRVEGRLQDFNRDLAGSPDFTLALDFIEGRITHVVLGVTPPRIMTVEEAFRPTDLYGETPVNGPINLLSFTGHYDAKGNRITRWAVSSHSDGSGLAREGKLCRSFEEAEAIVQNLFVEACIEYRNSRQTDGAGRKWGWRTIKEWERCGVTLEWPADIVAEINEAIAGNYAAGVKTAQEKLAAAMAEPQRWVP